MGSGKRWWVVAASIAGTAGGLATGGAVASAACADAACTPVTLPYSLDFSTARSGFVDDSGLGTGFTFVEDRPDGSAYRPDLLHLNTAASTLDIRTTSGIAYRSSNTLDNALGVPFTPRAKPFALRTTLVSIPPGKSGLSQAGLWLGTSQDDYVKLVVIAARGGTRVHLLREVRGVTKGFYDPVGFSTTNAVVSLRLRADLAESAVTGAYTVNGGPVRTLATLHVPPAFFARWNVGDVAVATGGIFATHRLAPASLRYSFADFEAACVDPCAPGRPQPDPDFGDGDPPVGEPSEGEGLSGGGGAPAPPTGPTVGGPPGSDSVATLKVRRRASVNRLLRHGLRGRLACTDSCSASLSLRLRPGEKRRLPRPGGARRLASFSFAAPADVSTRFRVRMPVERLRGLRRPVRATVRVRVEFGDGHVVLRRPLKIRPSR
jgi:hypothetical protein